MPDIVMIPTSFERSVIEKWLREQRDETQQVAGMPSGWTIELCGFGLIAAAALTTEAIAKHCPAHVLLLGIAGALNDNLNIGDAAIFDVVTCHGIGVGTCLSDSHQSADVLGWNQCEADSIANKKSIGDSLPLFTINLNATSASQPQGNQLVSVTCASANTEEAHRRSKLFPRAIAEDMEGFGVALACARANVPLTIIRGISNRAGDREHSRWQVDQALRSAVNLAMPLLHELKTKNEKP
jgi:futalosine hydrolase